MEFTYEAVPYVGADQPVVVPEVHDGIVVDVVTEGIGFSIGDKTRGKEYSRG
jgi:hypothetical protein